MKNRLYIFLILFSIASLSNAQLTLQNNFNSIIGEQCLTSKNHQELYQNDPVYRQNFDAAQLQVKSIINSGIRVGGTYTIPVVVHVMHLGSPIGTNENISDAQIQSAIDNLNDAYGNIGYNGLDIEIQFALAVRDPDCNSTTGINRINASGLTSGGDAYATKGATDNNRAALKALSNWSNSDYYNIWIVTEIDDNGGGAGTQGYAYFPGAGNGTDGAVILYNAFGYDPTGALGYNLKSYTNYNVTTIHELGHAFDLFHTFEGDGTGSTCPADTDCSLEGDECCDTDAHRRNDGTDCEAPVPNTCKGVSSSVVYNNFMAYSSDYCQDRFTADQKLRMRAAMEGPRASLLTSLALTAAPSQAPNTLANSCSPVTSATGLSGGYGGIMSVTFGTRTSSTSYSSNDESTYGTSGYLDFSLDCLKYEEVEEGATVPISVTTWFNDHNVKIYVDWNNNGVFDSGEQALNLNISGTASSGNDMASGNIVVPGGAVTGEFLRIRFNADIGTVGSACEAPTYGQVEDYAIFINPAASSVPVAGFSANTTSVCSGSTVTFTDASTDATGWNWDFGTNATPATATGQGPHAVTYTGSGASTVVLDVTGPGGSDNETKSNYITRNSTVTPSVSIASNDPDNSICSGTSVTFTATPTNGGSTPSYQWKLNNGNVGTNSTSYVNSSLANGDVVKCVMTSNASCPSPSSGTSNSITMTVITSVSPSVSVSSDDADNSICTGTNVTFTATPTNGGSTPSYQWKLNNGNVGTNSSTYANSSLANGDVVKCVMTSNAACASPTTGTSNTVTMTVNTSVTPSINISSDDPDNTICAGTSVIFTATPTNGGSSPSYQWKLNGGNVGTSSTSYTNSSLSNGDQVTCVLTSSDACASPTTGTSNTVTMTVNPSVTPSVSISSNDPDNSICSGTSVTFTATPTNGGSTPSYQWKLNNGNVGTNSTSYVNSSLANGDVVKCVMTSNASCPSPSSGTSNTITMTVITSISPSVSVSSDDADNSICTGTNVTFTATPTNGGSTPSYQWKLNNGNVGTNSSTYANSSLANGDVVKCVMTSSAACASPTTGTSNTVTMTVNTSVTPSISISSDDPDNTICAGTSVIFTATPTNGGSSPSYQWKLNGGNVGSSSTTYSNSSLSNGDQVTCVLTSSDACASPTAGTSNTVTMTVNPTVTPSVSISASSNPINSGDPVTFTATPTNGGSTPSYQWKLNGGNVGTNSSTYNNSSLTNGDQVSCVMTSNATCASPSSATSNTVSMTVNSVSCNIISYGPGGVGNSTTNRVWLDASVLNISDGSTVGSWNDKSGNNWVANTSAGYTRPLFRTNQLNGFPSIDFDGSNDFLKINGVSGLENQEISWFIVGNYNTIGRSQAMLHFAHTGSSYNKNLRFTLCYKNSTLNRINSGNLNTTGGGVPALHSLGTNTEIFSTIIGSNTIDAFSNGSLTGSNTGNFITPNANSFVTIGRRANLNDMYLDGNVSEVIVYNYQLNGTERTLVENYLSSKYGLTISNDKYSYEGTGHYYNLAGIGMEGGNPVSSSEGGSGIQISSPSSLDDNDYLLWAHNNASITNTTIGTPSGYNGTGKMMTRNWRVDKTNNIGTVSVSFYLDGITTGSTSDFELLIDSDGNFSNAARITSGYSYDSGCDIATWTGVNFSDGDYFTIGNPDGLALFVAPINELTITQDELEDSSMDNETALEIINNETEKVEMKLFPNPTTGLLNIENSIEGAEISLFNTLGQMLYSSSITVGRNQFDFSEFNAGIYFVHLKDINGETIAISQLMLAK